ncbi:hypothetical protein [Streptomyces viridochromogenes]|uniref:Putative RNA polymerase, sigma-24 subunit, ECF subfamily n=1 Tax=Streptomyces viridochromogenes Tue57 TaxID=1160705 RepID=L8P2J6_STRVR|nr:hypothetical protein [Streptomyces viridochromogenes]ELS51751.1 putative RNA polymerase, sigma-24 subunit, ECF subfamily [Streptomyces viridochromogenes Tue57]
MTGGKVPAARRPVEGRKKLSRVLVGLFQRSAAGMRFTTAEIDGEPAVPRGRARRCSAWSCSNCTRGSSCNPWAVVNSDKPAFAGRQPAGT